MFFIFPQRPSTQVGLILQKEAGKVTISLVVSVCSSVRASVCTEQQTSTKNILVPFHTWAFFTEIRQQVQFF
jgi:hypothetical protein